MSRFAKGVIAMEIGQVRSKLQDLRERSNALRGYL